MFLDVLRDLLSIPKIINCTCEQLYIRRELLSAAQINTRDSSITKTNYISLDREQCARARGSIRWDLHALLPISSSPPSQGTRDLGEGSTRIGAQPVPN